MERRQTLGQTQYNTLQTAISTNSEGNFQLYDCIVQKYNHHGVGGEAIGIARVESKKTFTGMLDLKDRVCLLPKNSCCIKIDQMNTFSFNCLSDQNMKNNIDNHITTTYESMTSLPSMSLMNISDSSIQGT